MQTLEMNEKRWSIAHDLASDLVDHGTDPNEFGKVTAFMRRYQKVDNAKDKFMWLLQRLANSNNAPIRSKKTPKYYQDIQNSCKKHLSSISDSGELMLILGWCMRLMRYYEVEPKRAAEEQRASRPAAEKPKFKVGDRVSAKVEPKRAAEEQRASRPAAEKPKFKVGDKVDATILKKEKDGMKVTVQLQTDNNEEVVFESYSPGPVGKKIKVRVLEVTEGGQVTQAVL